jgi:hypothetical protein
MPKGYHMRLDSGAIVTFGSPQAIRESLEVHWPAGQYEINEGDAMDLVRGRVGRRWGTAIKRMDGTVTLTAQPGPEQ